LKPVRGLVIADVRTEDRGIVRDAGGRRRA
jgi:hypothetical protein